MCSRHIAGHALSLRLTKGWLELDDKFQLNRRRTWDLGHIMVTTFETERPVTLVCNNLAVKGSSKRLDLMEALKSGLVELTESGKNEVVALPSPASQQLGQLKVLPKPSPQHGQVDIGIYTDTRSSEWKDILQPGQTYELRLSKSKDEVRAYYTEDFGSFGDVPPAQKLIVDREDSTIYFTVHDDPAPPKMWQKLEMPEVCHLTGKTPFILTIEYSTDSKETLTIDKSRSALSVFEEDMKSLEQLIDCWNTDTGEEVRWVAFFGCYDSDPHPSFPSDDDFVEISQDKPWRFECTLQNLDYEKDTVRSVFGLEAGQTYKARLPGDDVFTRWQYGCKEYLLSGSDEDKKRRWDIEPNKLGTLYAENISEPVVFTVVP